MDYFTGRARGYLYAVKKYPNALANELSTAVNMCDIQDGDIIINIPGACVDILPYITKDIDYTEEKILIKNKNNHGANYVAKIMITSDCFKDICMISLTEKAKEVRMYYKTVEKLLMDYYEDIENNLRKELGLIKNNQKDKKIPVGGHVYILQALNTTQKDMFKIGNSEDMKKRLRTYNTGNANDIKPLFTMKVKDIKGVESCIKNISKEFQYRKNKEVYNIDFRMLQAMYKNCKDFMECTSDMYNKDKKDFKKKLCIIKNDFKKEKKGGFYMIVDKTI
jgi:hypothetical protein